MTPAALTGLVRPFTLLAPMVGVATAAGVAAVALEYEYPAAVVVLACLAAASATGASNAWNQVFDLEIDRRNKPDRPLPSGRITKRAALAVGDALALTALVLAALVSPSFVACVAIGLLASWIYSAPPLRLKRSTAGALLSIALPRGLLVPVAGWSVIAAPRASDPWALGAVAGLFVFGAAATKDFADVEGDQEHGCRTLPIVWGARRASRFVAPFLVLPFVLYPVFGALGWLHAPVKSLLALAAVLIFLGGITARALMRNPEGLSGERGRSHPAWWGMYLLLLATQVGVWVAYLVGDGVG